MGQPRPLLDKMISISNYGQTPAPTTQNDIDIRLWITPAPTKQNNIGVRLWDNPGPY